MSWVAQEDFDTYSNGDLAGLNGGSGFSGAWVNNATALQSVESSVSYRGGKATSHFDASNNSFYTRPLTTAISGAFVMYVALRRTGTNAAQLNFSLRNASNGGRANINFNSSGNVTAGGTTIITGYSANQWYVFRITGNAGLTQYTVAYNTGAAGSGAAWSSESAAINFSNSGNIDTIGLSSDAGSITDYYDTITGTDPTAATVNGNFLGFM